MSQQGGHLYVPDKVTKEMRSLDSVVKGRVLDLLGKIRTDPDLKGLEPLKGYDLHRIKLAGDYRAVFKRVPDGWILIAVKHRSVVYKHLDRYSMDINAVTGGIEFVDVGAVEDSISERRPAARRVEERPLFADHSPDDLLALGVAEPLLPVIAKLTTEDELLGLLEFAPELTGEVLMALYDGVDPAEVRTRIVTPHKAAEPVDRTDYQRALARPATQVTTTDDALRKVLAGDFTRWMIFLHPAQRAMVEATYSGPARISGGPGTGKTVVALHRVCHLARRLPPGVDRPILLTTFARNLAEDLRVKLRDLGGDEVASRVDVVNISRLAWRIVRGAEGGDQPSLIADSAAIDEWKGVLAETGAELDPGFLAAEVSQVICGQVLGSFREYAAARRAGRTHPLSRADRLRVWRLYERFAKRLDERSLATDAMTAARAARLATARGELAGTSGSGVSYRYRHVVIDEAQDLHPAHWKMLRAMVRPGPDDMFILADTRQRIYDNVVALSSLGINIRGRSRLLHLNYRTSKQILDMALRVLSDDKYDDLDGGVDTLVGYRSVLRGAEPTLRGFESADRELDGVVDQIRAWADDTTSDAMAVAVPTKARVDSVIRRLNGARIPATEVTTNGVNGDGVRVGTIHRFKGLEFQRLIIAGVSDGTIPRSSVDKYRDSDPVRYRRDVLRDRSLLFVAATRARDSLVITWSGTPSRFLP